eukprot:GEMP01025064.1.p1 GENE.GEMP01025064.1~~GEMP01025064.1.p1  ORF type:complete len:205 (+),score=43.74 GEMP01025064.1:116-730(+)
MSKDQRNMSMHSINLNESKDAQAAAEAQAARLVKNQAKATAKKEVTKTVKTEATVFKLHIVENRSIIKFLCIITGLCLTTFSVMGLINFMNAFEPINYIVTAFNVFFGLVIVLVEGPPSWKWCGVRLFIFKHFGFLGRPLGRALFYCYISIMIFGMLPKETFWLVMYCLMASVLLICGIIQIIALLSCCKKEKHQELLEDDETV